MLAVSDSPIQASFELTAMICHIIDEDEADTQPNAAAAAAGSGSSNAGLKSPSPTAGRGGNSSSSRLPHQVGMEHIRTAALRMHTCLADLHVVHGQCRYNMSTLVK
jgi:hypothetical protein